VKVFCGEGLAIHAGLESCATCREVWREMLTEVRVGQPLSPEIDLSRVPTFS
jgi:hypothetical protein